MNEKPTFNFPHEKLTPINGKPDAKTIQLLRQEIFTNARAINSNRGGGKHGHMYAVLHPTDYYKKYKQTYTEPIHPGEQADQVFATERQLIENNRRYDRQIKEFQTTLEFKNAIKKMIFQAVDKKYYRALEDPEDGYADIEPATIIKHLTDKYMKITEADLEKNREKLLEPWDPNEPIDTLWGKIDDIIKFAKQGNDPIHEKTVQHRTIAMFQRQGIYQRYIDEWYDMPQDKHTMDAFKEHFEKADEHRQRNMTTKEAGYDGAAYQAKTTQDAIWAAIDELKNKQHNNDKNAQCVIADGTTRMYYCWSHGIGFNPGHTSKLCHNRKPGHKEEATTKNRMGGCGWIMGARPRDAKPNQE